MINYYFIPNGKEIKIGDTLTIVKKDSVPNSAESWEYSFRVTEKIIEEFSKMNLIKKVEKVSYELSDSDMLDICVNKLGNKEITYDILCFLKKVSKQTLSSLYTSLLSDYIQKENPVVEESYILAFSQKGPLTVIKVNTSHFPNIPKFRKKIHADMVASFINRTVFGYNE